MSPSLIKCTGCSSLWRHKGESGFWLKALLKHCCLATLLLMLHSVLSNAKLPSQEDLNSQPVSAMFVFGDSISDAGNNNFLSSLAKSNYWPYGCDFNQGPTGRFSNGKTVIDILSDKLAMPYIPAFADPTAIDFKKMWGVNYASASAGILDETGRHWGDRYSLSQQVMNFEKTLDQLGSIMVGKDMTQYLAKSITFMEIGSNDYINNYLLPSLYDTSLKYKPPEFASLLLDQYARQVLALYSLGLRKFFLVGLSPLGCIPYQRASGQAPVGGCVEYVNQILGYFNEGLRSLVEQLNANHTAGKFVYFNAYNTLGDLMDNPASYGIIVSMLLAWNKYRLVGFTVIDRACCGLGPITCLLSSIPCPDRNQYLFWDAYHTTEAANIILAQRVFSGLPSDCYPINVQKLALI